MQTYKTILEFQPRKVGPHAHPVEAGSPSEQSSFMQLLKQVYREAANERTRVSLPELQSRLLRRGWHP